MSEITEPCELHELIGCTICSGKDRRELLGKDVAILRHRSGPEKDSALSLREFRERLDSVPSLFDSTDTGACGCDPWGGAGNGTHDE